MVISYYIVYWYYHLVLFRLSIKVLLVSEEGGSDQQMKPELLNEAYQRKLHDKNFENAIKNSMIPCFRHINEVCSRFHGKRQTDRQTTTYINPAGRIWEIE